MRAYRGQQRRNSTERRNMMGNFAVGLTSRAQEFSSGLRLHKQKDTETRFSIFSSSSSAFDCNGEKVTV